MEEDPLKRRKRFLVWDGNNNYKDVGDATVDVEIAGALGWTSYWDGPGEPPEYRDEEERRPQKVLKRPAADGSAGVEPTATSRGPKGKGKTKKGPDLTTTAAVVQAQGGPKGRGKPPGFTLWPNRPGKGSEPLAGDPIQPWDTGKGQDDPNVPAPTKRQRRNLRAAILSRSFRNWATERDEAIHIHKKNYYIILKNSMQ